MMAIANALRSKSFSFWHDPCAMVAWCSLELFVMIGRQAIRPTIGRVSSAKDAACLKGRVEMEHPNKLIDSFSGSIELEAGGADGRVSR